MASGAASPRPGLPRRARPEASYFRDTAVRVRDIERVLASTELAGKLLGKIRSGALLAADVRATQLLVRSAVSWASSTRLDDAYRFLVDAWRIVFHEQRHAAPLDALRQTLRQDEPRLVHMMLNRGDCAAYDALVAPLYVGRPASVRPWAVTAMETLRPRVRGGVYTCDREAMVRFLDSPQALRAQKHRMVAMFATKALLSSRSRENVRAVARALAGFFVHVEDAFRVCALPHFAVYRRPLALLAATEPGATEAVRLERLALLHEALADRTSPLELADFFLAVLRASAEVAPHTALLCWLFKQSVLNAGPLPGRRKDCRTAQDLAGAMLAHIQMRAYDQALAVYAAHELLQDEQQITLLLRASERNKDWKLLQQQFEAMYGRGNLPYVVHYAVVMGALASLGAAAEVEQLYTQLLRRQLQPTAPIFRALVTCSVNAHDSAAAEKWHAEFMAAVAAGSVDPVHVPELQLQMLEARLPLMSAPAAVAEFERLAALHRDSPVPFIDASTIRTLLRHVLTLYSLRGFEAVWSVADELALVDDSVYADALAFLTKMGQFKRADDLAYAAHLESPVPFQNSLILAAQLRNYRQWRKQITDAETHQLLSERIHHIVSIVDDNASSPRHLGSLLAEVIKHFTSLGKPDLARPYLDRANAANISSERHFVPFLQEYSANSSYNDNSDVLNLYQEMVSRKMTITARTYYYLSRSLLVIDVANKKGHTNSLNLLQSVLEMYGFSVLQEKGTSKVSVSQLSQNAIHLLRIVSDYAIEVSMHDEGTMDLLLNFLKQMREKLDKHIDYSFRVSILTEMSKVYRVFGDLHVANSLVDNAFREMDDVIEQLPQEDPLPKLLQLDYRKTIDIKMNILNQRNAPAQEYRGLLEHVSTHNIRLSAYQLQNLSHRVLSGVPPTKESVSLILNVCERFLVAGNWAEVKINRLVQYIYRMYLVYLGRTMSPDAIADRYALFNQLYDVQDVEGLLREHLHVRSPRTQLERALRDYQALCPREDWTLESFFEKSAEFFTPERTFASRNFIQPNLSSALVTAIELVCDGDNTVAFELYDEYPDTMEYLLFYVVERYRVVSYRNGINKIIGQSNADRMESRAARRQLSIETLQHSWGQ
ncbi:hypothetical protein METBIDRAFT_38597 [Metschnikowia bicuspidata var. bicuspidata NRRL YB-4993]|uniref:Mitochondrial group I intron splicing factor CCM1 n=1 Tax=Metschnikowia bicuspidata var. bicuspidata NRRL YB-4993 TaxID=869754 RepID=A0A1A0HGB5_9ASCO|nr:hypothetical protein METBIDRAFT_38597 [Metschnikowia bicuspidata var. bicuspidata NRRL YB-4993]OBA23046.1 hypothetical protein METBIDRAFT_38597 [Metschnikowia bicuspidata var. bicuspidata NRRL YB-4993]